MSDDEPVIPSQRLSPKGHLARAAKAPVAGDAEHYHVAAAQAEALARIEETLGAMHRSMLDFGVYLRSIAESLKGDS